MKSLISPAEGVNPHVLLEGQSGSGKSLAARHIAFERMRQGQEVNVIDTHTPEMWGGAKQVFQGATAGTEAADFLRKALESRKEQKAEALSKGEQPDFKPMTVVFSDFARLMKDTPQLGVEFATLLTEARKFRISIIADTTALTGASSGIKGIQDVLQNFGQKVKFYAPTPQGEPRRAEVGGEVFPTPQLPEYKERIDYSLIRPPAPPPPPEPPDFDPLAVARERIRREEERVAVDAEYAKLKPPEPPPTQPTALDIARKRVEAERFRAEVDAEYAKLKPQEPKAGIDQFLEAAESLRGTIGGTFGRIAGIALDIAAKVREGRDKVAAATPPPVVPVARPVLPPPPPEEYGPFPQARPAPYGPTTHPPVTAPATPGMPPGSPTTAQAASGAARPVTSPTPAPAPAAAGGGGLMTTAAAAIPPVAIALAVKEAVGAVIQGVGNVAKFLSSADDDPSKQMAGLSEAVGKISFVAGEIGKVLSGLMENFTRMADRFGEYNPEIAQAQAMAEINRTMNDMRRAQQSGGELARFIREQSEFQQRFEEMKMKVWSKILPVLTSILSGVNAILDFLHLSDADMTDIVDPTSIILNPASVMRAREGATRELSAPRDLIEMGQGS